MQGAHGGRVRAGEAEHGAAVAGRSGGAAAHREPGGGQAEGAVRRSGERDAGDQKEQGGHQEIFQKVGGGEKVKLRAYAVESRVLGEEHLDGTACSREALREHSA